MHSLKPASVALPERRSDVDQLLIARVRRGDKAAFDALVRKYQHRIVKLVSRYVRDSSEALDVAQEAFIKTYRAIPGFRGDCAFYTWFYRIAINTAKNYLAMESRNRLDHDVDLDDPEPDEVRARLSDLDTPERLLLTEEIEHTVERAIDALPEELRTAIVLREIDGMSYEQIAATMACPIGTVRSRIFRAREVIDGKLQGLLN